MVHRVDKHVGEKVREARNIKNLSQKELGKRLGVSFQQIQKYETGTNRIGASRLFTIAEALGQPVDFFFQGLARTAKKTGRKEASPKLSKQSIRIAYSIQEIESPALIKHIIQVIQSVKKLHNIHNTPNVHPTKSS